jgi:hypothetical protein
MALLVRVLWLHVRLETGNRIRYLVAWRFLGQSDVTFAECHGDISVNHLCTGFSTDSVDEID